MFGPSRSPARPRRRLLLEELESRTLLSASSLNTLVADPLTALISAPQASVSLAPQGHGGGSGGSTNANPTGYTPSQIRTAYGFNQITFSNGTIKGDGNGQTIAIVDAYNDPNIISDLDKFDQTFSINGGTQSLYQQYGASGSFLTKVNQNGVQGSYPITSSGWSGEISLDVEWAHAMAPGAKILLVEANSNSLSNLLTAVKYAEQHASVVSMSWGGSEFSSETSNDASFNYSGVTFVASSGDSGVTEWPAVSPNVVAVGGTSLTADSTGNYQSETGWSGSGGGISAYENLPGYQPSTYSNGTTTYTDTSGKRLNPDVAYNANPNTGYAIYDTVPYYGQTGWFEVGGTSAGAPQWSALIAIADQGRQVANNNIPNPLSGASQTLPAIYNMASNDFHDITSGRNNGYSAGSGYDLVTGRGTPIANLVVNALVNATSTGSVGGLVVTSGSGTSTTPQAKASILLAGTPTESLPSSGPASFVAPATVATAVTGPAILAQPTQTSTVSGLSLSPNGMSTLAFSAGQAPATFGETSTSQIPSFQLSALGFRSGSSLSAQFGTSLQSLRFESADSVPMAEADDAAERWFDDPLIPRPAIPSPFQGGIDLNLDPALPAEGQPEEMPAGDAYFLERAGSGFFDEDIRVPADNDSEESAGLRVPALALLGVFASSLWMKPDAAEETRKRRRSFL
jgi:hypothetical protein